MWRWQLRREKVREVYDGHQSVDNLYKISPEPITLSATEQRGTREQEEMREEKRSEGGERDKRRMER